METRNARDLSVAFTLSMLHKEAMRYLMSLALLLFASAASAQTDEEIAFMTDLLNEVQALSFQHNAEYCGYLGYNRLGVLVATPPLRGEEATCFLPNWPYKLDVIASYHSHGTYSPEYDSEVPSVQDMQTDQAEGIDGYVSTPGGRMWYVETDTMVTRQLCNAGCLMQDPNFVPEPMGRIRQSYTLRALMKHEAY